jgi:hypothetical protein
MGVRSIEIAAEGLKKLTEEYTTLLKKFDKNVNDRMQLLQIEMELVEKTQKKFDKPIDYVLQTGMVASSIFVGPLGLVIGQLVLQGYRTTKSNGDLRQITFNSFIAAANSEAANFMLKYSANESEKFKSLVASYSNGTTIENFLVPPSGAKPKPSSMSKKTYKSDISFTNKNDITLMVLKSANRDMACRIFALKDILDNRNSREKYKKVTCYYGLSMIAKSMNVRGNHLGLKSREIIKLFYSGVISQSTEDAYSVKYQENIDSKDEQEVIQLLQQPDNDIHKAAISSRKNLLNRFSSQVAGSEIFARTTDYQRVYDTFPLENDVSKWARIDYKNQNKSLYYFYKHGQSADGALDFRKLHQISSEKFFELLDTKILVRAYFNDYCDYFEKKIAGSLKKELSEYMPDKPETIKNNWKSISKNKSRVKDIIIINFLVSIPQILLGAPLVSQLIKDHKGDEPTKNVQQIEVERVYGAIINGVWSACSSHKHLRQDFTNRRIWDRVSPFIDQIEDIMFMPFISISPILANLEETHKDQLEELGINNEYIVNNSDQAYNRKVELSNCLDEIDYNKLSPFIKATTPGVEKRVNVHRLERNSNMYEGNLFDFDWYANPVTLENDKTLSANYIHYKLLEKVKAYILKKEGINSFKTPDFINSLPKKADKYSYTQNEANDAKQGLIQHYQNKGIAADKYSEQGYLKNAIDKVDSQNRIVADHGDLHISGELDNLFLQQKFSIDALQLNKASQAQVLKNMHKTMVALAAIVSK